MAGKLRIGVILQGGSAWMGGAEYSRNLLKAIYALPEAVQMQFELRVLSGGNVERQWYADMPARFWHDLWEQPATPPMWVRAARRIVPERFASWSELPAQARRLGVDFLYPLNPTARIDRPVKSAAWIPDFQHRHLPQFFAADEWSAREREFAEVAQRAPRIVLSSESAARDFRAFYPDAAHKAEVLRFCTGADEAWFSHDPETAARKHGLPERFFIVCNQFWRHKNHRIVFEALNLLKRSAIEPTIVCTGKREDYRWPEYAGEVERMLDAFQVRGQVRLLGLVPRVEQIQLMRRALAVIQPSLFEGWSTVVEDSRALGKRLVLSDLEVHREQAPPRVIHFDPHDAQHLADVLAEWWQTLAAGPELAAEAAARQANRDDLERFGRRFLALAASADRSPVGP